MTTHCGHSSMCHLCGANGLDWLPRFSQLQRITSDCKPWPKGGGLGVCRQCGVVQSRVDDRWRAETEAIYQAYTVYYQSEGEEQRVFDQSTGQGASRSDRLLSEVRAAISLPTTGRLLDIGCGNGGFLRAVSRWVTGWSLFGNELHDTYRDIVERIPQVEALHTCTSTQVPGEFDVVSMLHVLEHIASPREFLAGLQCKLAPGGMLLIQVPDHARNPFDLLIADHCSHFTGETLTNLVHAAGYQPLKVSSEWVPKELSLVAVVDSGASPKPVDSSQLLQFVRFTVNWLEETVRAARTDLTGRQGGLFGTSIAATWLFAELGDTVSFFVDEDRSRQGRRHMGLPVYAPEDIPAGSHVFLALPLSLAEAVGRRLSRPDVTYHLPPPAGR